MDRDVAIKVLPEAFAHDAKRLALLTREAKTLASLNHPHIAYIHGLEDGAGFTALVMELIEGEDLSQRIARGPIPIDEALAIARQIAAALEAAHEQGIIHRDLKTANIKIRDDGTVKLLDFGIATVTGLAGASPGVSMAETVMTNSAQIVGTPGYMAPEQARGRHVDRRTDIWAFGVVVFEMVTGHRAFHGENTADTLIAVVSQEPDWGALPAATSAGLRSLLTRCLKKDPKARLRDIGDARLQIEELLSGAPDQLAAPALPRSASPEAGLPAAAGTSVERPLSPPLTTPPESRAPGPTMTPRGRLVAWGVVAAVLIVAGLVLVPIMVREFDSDGKPDAGVAPTAGPLTAAPPAKPAVLAELVFSTRIAPNGRAIDPGTNFSGDTRNLYAVFRSDATPPGLQVQEENPEPGAYYAFVKAKGTPPASIGWRWYTEGKLMNEYSTKVNSNGYVWLQKFGQNGGPLFGKGLPTGTYEIVILLGGNPAMSSALVIEPVK